MLTYPIISIYALTYSLIVIICSINFMNLLIICIILMIMVIMNLFALTLCDIKFFIYGFIIDFSCYLLYSSNH